MTADLIGRRALVDAVGELVEQDVPVLLVGPSGVGKTTLLRAVASAAERSALTGGGLEMLRWQPYVALSRAVGPLEAGADPVAVAAAVEAVVGPDVLVVDDVQLADGPSLAVLELLAGQVTVLAASRPQGEDGDAVVERLTGAGYVVVDVPPLDDDAAAELAARVNPRLRGAALRQLLARAGGVALLIEELARGGADGPLTRSVVPRLDALSPSARRTALRLSLDLRPQPVSPTADAQELVAAEFAIQDGEGLLRIRHGLVAEAVLAGADEREQRAAFLDLAVAATTTGEVARYLLAAGDLLGAHRAAIAAAEEAANPGERAEHLTVAARSAAEDDRLPLVLAAAEAMAQAGRPHDALALLDDLAATQSRLPVAEQARLHRIRAGALWDTGRDALSGEQARAGLALIGERGDLLEARLLADVVRAEVRESGPHPDHRAMLGRAMDLSQGTGGHAQILNAKGVFEVLSGDPEGMDTLREGLRAATDSADADTEMRSANNIIATTNMAGDPTEGIALARAMIPRARALGLGEWQGHFHFMLANLLALSGRYPESLQQLDEVDLGGCQAHVRLESLLCRAMITIDLGLFDEAERLLQAADLAHQGNDSATETVVVLRAQMALWAGRPEETLALVEPYLRQEAVLGDQPLMTPMDAWARYDLGLPVTTKRIPAPHAMHRAIGAEVEGVRLLAEDPGQAAEILDHAAHRLRGCLYANGLRAQWGAAEARRLAGAPDAVEALLAVEQEADRTGLDPVLARVHRSLRLAGVTRSAPRGPDRSGLVTAREGQVLDLVARGHTYAQIARRLGVGRPTVRRLLGNACGKLGATDRRAAVLARLDGPEHAARAGHTS